MVSRPGRRPGSRICERDLHRGHHRRALPYDCGIISSGSLHGIWHVSSEPITKFDLLVRLNDAFNTHTVIERDEDFRCDRSLLSDRFYDKTGLSRPSWDEM